MSSAFTGFTVIDLTQGLCGPFASMRLGDAGAEIIKIEPLTGDSARTMGPPFIGPICRSPTLKKILVRLGTIEGC